MSSRIISDSRSLAVLVTFTWLGGQLPSGAGDITQSTPAYYRSLGSQCRLVDAHLPEGCEPAVTGLAAPLSPFMPSWETAINIPLVSSPVLDSIPDLPWIPPGAIAPWLPYEDGPGAMALPVPFNSDKAPWWSRFSSYGVPDEPLFRKASLSSWDVFMTWDGEISRPQQLSGNSTKGIAPEISVPHMGGAVLTADLASPPLVPPPHLLPILQGSILIPKGQTAVLPLAGARNISPTSLYSINTLTAKISYRQPVWSAIAVPPDVARFVNSGYLTSLATKYTVK